MNKRLRIALILVAIILIAALAISLAYSKYFSKITGEGTATVAKWNFKVNGQADTIEKITLGNTIADNSKVADKKLAPGTSGAFTVKLDASGTEVALDYTIKFANVSAPFPSNLKFYRTKTGNSYSNEITNITTEGIKGSMAVDAGQKTEDVVIYWNWAYQTGGVDVNAIADNDEIDTTEGETAKSITFDVIVTGTQQENK